MKSNVRRVGLLVPASDPVVESDWHRWLPPGLSFHVNRMPQALGTRTAGLCQLEAMCDAAPELAQQLGLISPELIVFACSSGSFFRGKGWDLEIAGRISARCNVPALTTATAIVRSLGSLRARCVSILTPYGDEMNGLEGAFLAAHGIDVGVCVSIPCEFSAQIAEIEPEAILECVRRSRSMLVQSDALLITCTALRSMEVASLIESELGVPVVTSNSATLWAALRMLGVGDRLDAGRLFLESSIP